MAENKTEPAKTETTKTEPAKVTESTAVNANTAGAATPPKEPQTRAEAVRQIRDMSGDTTGLAGIPVVYGQKLENGEVKDDPKSDGSK